jgi:hypothetical protein
MTAARGFDFLDKDSRCVINRTGAGHWELAMIRAAFVLLAFAALAAL